MQKEEFYIGWMQTAPVSVARFIRKYLFVLLTIVMTLVVLLVTQQKEFSTANFEFGKPTVVKGIFTSSPVPHLLVTDGKNNKMVLLVGYGKHGADGIMKKLAAEKKTTLEGKELQLRGTLLYGDGKVLMQVNLNEAPLVGMTDQDQVKKTETDLGRQKLQGEIIDPKCYFGVMKPGEGKPHKDCAIRCILGGHPTCTENHQRGRSNRLCAVT